LTLEPRLEAVAGLIGAEVHLDIGADHALLPRYLLERGRARRVIVVEKARGPYEVASQALASYPQAEVRLGDGFGPVAAGEVESASMSGLGAPTMVRILAAHPDKLPPHLVLQPNASAEPLRRWAFVSGYHLVHEAMTPGFWRYAVLALERKPGPDPAYEGVPPAAAFAFGPQLLRARHPLLMAELTERLEHVCRSPHRRAELERLEDALAFCKQGA
jgi:tRNA (adenine22-N1)-methyltransferase